MNMNLMHQIKLHFVIALEILLNDNKGYRLLTFAQFVHCGIIELKLNLDSC